MGFQTWFYNLSGIYGIYWTRFHRNDLRPSATRYRKLEVFGGCYRIFITTAILPGILFPQERIFHSLKTFNSFVFLHCFPEQCLHLFKFTGTWLYLHTSIVCIRSL